MQETAYHLANIEFRNLYFTIIKCNSQEKTRYSLSPKSQFFSEFLLFFCIGYHERRKGSRVFREPFTSVFYRKILLFLDFFDRDRACSDCRHHNDQDDIQLIAGLGRGLAVVAALGLIVSRLAIVLILILGLAFRSRSGT